MKKKIFSALFSLLTLISLGFSATYTYPGSPTTGTITWSPGDIVYITAATTFTNATITGTGTAANPLYIYISNSIYAYIDTNSSLTLTGTGGNYVIVDINGTGIHKSFDIRSSSSARFTNVQINNADNGLSIESNDVVVDKVIINQPDQYGIWCNNVSPRITRTKFIGKSARTIFSIFYNYTTNSPAKLPELFANEITAGTRTGTNGHIAITMPSNPASTLTFYFEGNYWSGTTPSIYKYPFMTNVTYDYLPALNPSPYTGTALNSYYTINTSSGGTVNGSFYIYDSDYYTITGGDLTVANGANLYMGVSRNVVSSTVYHGNSTLSFSGLYSLTASSGANVQIRGTTALPNAIRAVAGGTGKSTWNQLLISNGSTFRADYTTISNATTALSIPATPTSLTLTSVTLSYNTVGLSTNASSTFSNLAFQSNTNAFRLTGGTPVVHSNYIYGGGTGTETAFQITGGSFPAGNIRSNTLNSTIDAYASSSGETGIVYMEGNYWGANPPVTTNFSGTNIIDYEPWKSATGVNTSLRPTSNLLIPVNNANLSAAPTRLTFNAEEIGMYNDSPITYQLQLDTSPAFTAPTVFTAANQRHWVSISANVSSYTFAVGTRYYWRVRSQSSADGLGYGSWTPSWNFIIAQPVLQLTITTNPNVNYASAGSTVVYQIAFDYISTNPANITNSKVVSCLPDDVYFNGNLNLSGFSSSYGTITVTAYQDLAGTVALGSYSGTVSSTLALSNGYAGWVSAANNHLVRRIDTQINVLNTGNTGYITYGTIVK
jgi:hypothetical protein